MSGYVADYIKEQDAQELDREFKAEREWAERYAEEEIPDWMDEEEISEREYEGLDRVEEYTQARYAESPEDIDERIHAYQESYGETAEERVRAYQAEEEPISEREDAERSYEIEQRERAFGIRAF